jgi:hypothetical protein
MNNDSTPTIPTAMNHPEATQLAADCAALLKKQQGVIKEIQNLMMTQRLTREQVMQVNPFQWASEVVHDWALSQLDPANKITDLKAN